MERRRPHGRDTGAGGLFSGGTYRRGSGLGTGPVGGSTGSSQSDKGLLGNLAGQLLGGGSGLGGLGSGLFGSGTGSTGSYGSGLGGLGGGLGNLGNGLGSGLGQLLNNMTNTTSTYGAGGHSSGGLKKLLIPLIIGGIAAAAIAIPAGSCSAINSSNSGLGGLLSGVGGLNTSSYQSTNNSNMLSQLLGGGGSTTSTGWADGSGNMNTINTNVADGSRAKYTNIIGNGEDTVTIMVYMCGSDLETGSGMATSDLQEMTKATLSDKVNVIVYTGGARQWQNNVVSSSVNQIYRVTTGGLERLEENAGTGAMSDPATLTSFIQYASQKYPANRNQLILWDHGGGSISGYAYDEKNASRGYMSLAGINTALENAGVKFDYIGFDACLMATVENAIMLNKHADYLIASEETEPGIGWYYTNWLTKLSANTSMPTVEIGKMIVDDFNSTCATTTPGQKTTLSVVDLAELSNTVPGKLSAFSKSISQMITEKKYSEVAAARNNTREFARSTAIDQVDLVHLANNMGTNEGLLLGEAIKGAVKYNRTSSNMTNSYGLSIYFPYQRVSKVDSAVNTYSQIGMDADYARAIQEFASMETAGQASGGGMGTSLNSLLQSLSGSQSYYGNSGYGSGSSSLSSLLGNFLGGRFEMVDGLSGNNTNFLQGRAVSRDAQIEYIQSNSFDPTKLVWSKDAGGQTVMKLEESQWELVNTLDMGLFLKDGEGYIDLGLDNQFDFNDDGDLIPADGKIWIGINGQTVAYYHDDTAEEGKEYTISGHIPAMLNDKRVNIMVVFDSAHPEGYVTGAEYVYKDGETETVPKSVPEIKEGDKIDFLCDYYTLNNEYNDSYMLGDQLTVTGQGLKVTAQDMSGEPVKKLYRFKDIYNQVYWTPEVPADTTSN